MDAQAWVALGAAAIAIMVAVGTVAYTIGSNHATRRELSELGIKFGAYSKDLWSQLNHIKDTYARRDDLSSHIDRIEAAIAGIREMLAQALGVKK